MTNYIGWTPPPGVGVVSPPVHGLTMVDVFYSDGSTNEGLYAENLNWSSFGDGPSVVAYAVVQEYVEPKVAREWWLTPSGFAYASHEVAGVNGEQMSKLIHVREVPDPSREVVACAEGWSDWRTDVSEWNVTTHDVRFECIGGIHKISTRPRPHSPKGE